jgi:hypothetical protein
MNETRILTMDMAGRAVEHERNSPFLVFRLSWVAYVRETWAFLVRLLLCIVGAFLLSTALDRFGHLHTETWLPVAGPVVAILWTVYSVMYTKSVRLFTDENGVWMGSGVFPWEKGITGVQWRDLGQAGYSQSMVSWALRSYNVEISHRFTVGTELRVRHVHRGNLAVEHINAIMSQLQGRIFQR